MSVPPSDIGSLLSFHPIEINSISMIRFDPIGYETLEEIVQHLKKKCTRPLANGQHFSALRLRPTGPEICSYLATLRKEQTRPFTKEQLQARTNLPFLSKIIEKAVFEQSNTLLSLNNCFDVYQSGLDHTRAPGLERPPLKHSGKVFILVLDLSAATCN